MADATEITITYDRDEIIDSAQTKSLIIAGALPVENPNDYAITGNDNALIKQFINTVLMGKINTTLSGYTQDQDTPITVGDTITIVLDAPDKADANLGNILGAIIGEAIENYILSEYFKLKSLFDQARGYYELFQNNIKDIERNLHRRYGLTYQLRQY
jgi:hypothetical protein